MTSKARLTPFIAFAILMPFFGSAPTVAQKAVPAASSQEAQETFEARCSTCHADHGEGSEVGASLNVPDLRSASVQKNDDAFLRQLIKSGKGNMPAFGRDFSDEQIGRIIQLVRSFAAQSNLQAEKGPETR